MGAEWYFRKVKFCEADVGLGSKKGIKLATIAHLNHNEIGVDQFLFADAPLSPGLCSGLTSCDRRFREFACFEVRMPPAGT